MNIQVSSEAPGKLRWTELSLTGGPGDYVLTVEGISDLPEEWDHAKTLYCAKASEVVNGLRAPGGGISNLAKELLRLAAENDPNFKELEEASDRHSRRGGRGR